MFEDLRYMDIRTGPRTKFWENQIGNAIGDDRFCWDMLISPDKVLKSGQS